MSCVLFMENQNYILNYFIAEVEITPEKLTIILNKDLPAYFFNEADERAVTQVEIINPDFNGSVKALKEQIDFYEDGIIFDILKEKGGKTAFITTDLGGRTFTIRGTDIKRQELPYSKEQLWTAIKHYIQHLEASTRTKSDLQEKLEAANKYAEREINSANQVLSNLPESDSRRQKYTIKRDTWQTIVNLLKLK